MWPWLAWVLFGSAVVTAVLTVAYSLRAWLLVFFTAPAGSATEPEPSGAPVHESPWVMLTPLYLLAVPTVLGGLLVLLPEAVLGEGEYHLVHPTMAVAMTALVAVTAALVVWQWRRSEGRDPWHPYVLPHPQVDRLYANGVVRPVGWLAQLVRAGDRDVVETYTEGAGATARGLGGLLRLAQNGSVQTYLMVVVVGACAVAVAAGVIA